MTRFKVLSLFIVASIALWFITWAAAVSYYAATTHKNIFDQIITAVTILAASVWIFIFVLIAGGVTGMFIARSKGKTEVVKGFQYSLILVGILIVVYLGFLATLE